MVWTAHGTGSQRESSACTAGLPLRLAMVAAVAVIIVMPSQSAAQEPPETPPAVFQDLPLLVNLGDRIAVTDDTGRELQGNLVDISPSALSVLVAGTRYDLQEANITGIRQWRPDSVKNGALLGLLAGAGSTVALLEVSDHYFYPVQWAFWLSVLGGAGAGIGALVDASHTGSELIFSKKRSVRGVSVAPLLSRDRKGVAISLGF